MHRKLSLPREFHSLGPQHVPYQVERLTGEIVVIVRRKGQRVEIPTDVVYRCYEHLAAAPDHELPLEEIIPDLADSIRFGESLMGATLVAAGLAEVTGRRPLRLRSL